MLPVGYRELRSSDYAPIAAGLIAASIGSDDAEEYARQLAEGVEGLWEVPLLTCGRSSGSAGNRVVGEF